MKGFKAAIESEAIGNEDFRRILYTSRYSQLVLMSLRPGEEIGLETHEANDQFFRVESGHGRCAIDGHEYEISDGDAVIVPSGARHPIGFLSGLILGWKDELKGGAMTMGSIGALYLVLLIKGQTHPGWWFLILGMPALLFIIYGLLRGRVGFAHASHV